MPVGEHVLFLVHVPVRVAKKSIMEELEVEDVRIYIHASVRSQLCVRDVKSHVGSVHAPFPACQGGIGCARMCHMYIRRYLVRVRVYVVLYSPPHSLTPYMHALHTQRKSS